MATDTPTQKLRICHLYPDILNLYGDRGNTITLVQRCLWRGIDAELTTLCLGEDADFAEFDLFFLGGGQDFDQFTLLDDLGIGKPGSKASRLVEAVADDAVMLAICGGYQLLGDYYIGRDGKRSDFIGAVPFYTDSAPERMIGNMVFACDDFDTTVVGFENHSGKTHLPPDNPEVRPLGKVEVGYGNNGEDGYEGLRYHNTFCTYSHGPILPKNPAFADGLLQLALSRRYPGATLAPLDDRLEDLAHDTVLKRLRG